ncbi:MAG: error-prone DNA polymerase [Pseudomonadota bacterium]
MATSPDDRRPAAAQTPRGVLAGRRSSQLPEFTPGRVAGFAELHCLTNYSFLRGASHPEELVQAAFALGYRALAITDECSVTGVVKAHLALRDLPTDADGRPPLKLIIGAEFRFAAGFTLVLLAPDRGAYGQLCALITRLRRRNSKGVYDIELADLDYGIGDCIAIWLPEPASTVPPVAGDADADGRPRDIGVLLAEGGELARRLPRLNIGLELLLDDRDLDRTAHALTLSMRLDLPVVACNDVHLHHPARKPLQDVLTAIRHNTSVAELGFELQANAERALHPIDELVTRYPPEMLRRSLEIAAACHFSLDELRYEYPAELVPPQFSGPGGARRYLRELTYHGAAERWPAGIPPNVVALIEKELALIAELAYEHYFLTVQDIVAYARSQGILCQGRGSAANSAVCYCLFITEVDPDRMHLLFERFVSKERNEPPDIDVDFEHERREEVIQYIYTRYSRERAALAATLITYRPKSAIRDVGKALGLDADLIDLLARSLAWWDKKEELADRFRAGGIDPNSRVAKQFLFLVHQILGFPRHLSQHVGGFVISKGPLAQLVPVENAAMPDRTVIQWDKDDLEALGLLKIDVLALGMLTAIRKSLQLHNDFHRLTEERRLDIANIPAEDAATYAMLQRGDSIGVFQVESRAQMSMLPRLKPQNFYDLVVEVAIVRPGPIQGNMVHPYLRRRQGLETPTYSNDGVRRVLERTLGVPIFQEQVIELAMVAAGFTAGEADQLRRAMAAWKRRGGLEPFRDKLVRGMLARGHDMDFAERVFEQIKGFGEYGFPESHAASFALLVYVSAWLKRHSPAAFYCGLLNSLPMGFYSPSQLIQDADRHGIEIRGIDVQTSAWDHSLEAGTGRWQAAGANTPATARATDIDAAANEPVAALRLGLRLVKGLNADVGLAIATARAAGGPFRDTADLRRRAGLDRQSLEFLARAGALADLAGHRHQAHWEVARFQTTPGGRRAEPHANGNSAAIEPAGAAETWDQTLSEQGSGHATGDDAESAIELPAPAAVEDMLADYRYTSLTLGPHPLALLRDNFRNCHTALALERARSGQFVRIAGLVTGRQRPGSAAGVMFVTLEDETGNINVVVWQNVQQQFRAALLQSQLLMIKGVVEREQEVIHVVAGYLSDESHRLADISAFKSRDFH